MKTVARFLVLGGLSGVVCAAALQKDVTHSVSSASASPTAPPTSEVSVKGYRQWTRVNAKPHWVFSELAALCRSLTPQEQAALDKDPHKDKFVVVYVNEVARQAMLHQKNPHFPQGSLIVKEKLAAPDSTTPELLTVMHKRQKAYNPQGGNWEYLVLDGTGTRVQAQGVLQNCQSCHVQWKQTDYVSRAHLTEATRRQLK
jgi:hypothetical protein